MSDVVSAAPMWLVYRNTAGKLSYQSWSDLPIAGALIDPETGDDLSLVGWSTFDGSAAETSTTTDCEHDWQLVETGYERSWSTEMREDARVIVAHWTGSEDFSSEGSGDDRLRCLSCMVERPIPEGWEIDYV